MGKNKYFVEEKVFDDGSLLIVQKGTQYIGGCWNHVRKTLRSNPKYGHKLVEKHVRNATADVASG